MARDQNPNTTDLSSVHAHTAADDDDADTLRLREQPHQKHSSFKRAISAAAVASDMRVLSRALETYTKENSHQAEFENFVFSDSNDPTRRSRVYPRACDKQAKHASGSNKSLEANAKIQSAVETDARRPGFALRGIIEGPCSWAVKQPLYLFVRL